MSTTHRHHPFYTSWIALLTLVRQEIKRCIRLWQQTLIPPIITSTLYFVVFGRWLGQHVPSIHHTAYINYIAPGLIMMSVITNAYSHSSASLYLARFQKSIEQIVVSSMHDILMICGYTIGGTLRGIFVGIEVLIIAQLFTPITIQHTGTTLLVMILSAALFSSAGMINALLAQDFNDISIVPTFILAPLSYLGGVFYAIDQLPPLWQKISYYNPIVWIVNAFRYAMLNVSEVPIHAALSILAGLTLTIFLVNVACVKRGVGLQK